MQEKIKVNLSPQEAYNLIINGINADLVHDELHQLENGQAIGTIIFEKYFMRVENRVALIVMLDNFQGETEVRVVSTGSSQGWFFKFDWGAADSFARSVAELLEPYQGGDRYGL